jgi:hypothetical protein
MYVDRPGATRTFKMLHHSSHWHVESDLDPTIAELFGQAVNQGDCRARQPRAIGTAR